jgi:hypothetical protein
MLLLIKPLWGLNIRLTSQAESNKGANFDFFTRKKVKSPIEINQNPKSCPVWVLPQRGCIDG